MKKFVIISIILLLIGGVAFGFSLKHYIDVKHPAEKTTEAASVEDAQPVQPEGATQAGTPEAQPAAGGDIFAANYDKAKQAVENMSKEEMAGQLIVGVSSDLEAGAADLTHYGLAGFLFESGAFSEKTDEDIFLVAVNAELDVGIESV